MVVSIRDGPGGPALLDHRKGPWRAGATALLDPRECQIQASSPSQPTRAPKAGAGAASWAAVYPPR